jgi:hypothetical protein
VLRGCEERIPRLTIHTARCAAPSPHPSFGVTPTGVPIVYGTPAATARGNAGEGSRSDAGHGKSNTGAVAPLVLNPMLKLLTIRRRRSAAFPPAFLPVQQSDDCQKMQLTSH